MINIINSFPIYKYKNSNLNKTGKTAHNRTVCASPPVGQFGLRSAMVIFINAYEGVGELESLSGNTKVWGPFAEV